MSPSGDMGRQHRSFAAVESRYVRDLGRRGPSRSRAARAAAGPGCRSATERLDVTQRRVRAEIAPGSNRSAVNT
jgi:hypothetical protein